MAQAQAHHGEAHREAEDITRHYVMRRLGLTHRMLRVTVERAARLGQEYESSCATLRRDLKAVTGG
ncbi:hypothetical protein WJ438_06905 [Streptomyces sp. GD-15H]|uniref:hypothetical protein n=1 Tax=Streptomyces sp. GD-15H TaxID=3129112 RepID=UPI00324FF3D8